MLTKLFQNQKGQTILEITISLGIALAVVTGLIITTINGLKNSQFSKNQAQATKFAQEGIDIMRTIRDRSKIPNGSYGVCLSGDSLPSCNGHTWQNVLTTTFSSSNNTFKIQNSSCPNDTSYCLIYTPPTAPEAVPNSIMKRLVTIEDYATTTPQKKITVTVSWQDASGGHQSKLVTILGS